MEKTGPALRRLAIVVPMILFCALLYTFLHEGGHALFGVLFGGTLTAFNINFFSFTAHAGIYGEYTTAQRAVISAAGVSLPLLTWAALMMAMPRQANPIAQWFKIFYSVGVINTLLAWIIIPVLFLSGRAPGDDATNFLRISGFPPLLVSLTAVLLYLGGWALLLNRTGGLAGIRTFFKEDQGLDLNSTGQRRTAATILSVALVALATTIGLNASISETDRLAVLDGYSLAQEINLAEGSHTEAAVFTFRLENPQEVRFFVVLQKIEHGPVKIELRGPGGYSALYFQMNGDNQVGFATVHPQGEALNPGTYQVILTAQQERAGKVVIYTSGLN